MSIGGPTHHEVSVHLKGKFKSGEYLATCEPCAWRGPLRKRRDSAQRDAIEHQGGTLATVLTPGKRDPLPDPLGTEELFPGWGVRRAL
jgi:hypothetical protein